MGRCAIGRSSSSVTMSATSSNCAVSSSSRVYSVSNQQYRWRSSVNVRIRRYRSTSTSAPLLPARACGVFVVIIMMETSIPTIPTQSIGLEWSFPPEL